MPIHRRATATTAVGTSCVLHMCAYVRASALGTKSFPGPSKACCSRTWTTSGLTTSGCCSPSSTTGWRRHSAALAATASLAHRRVLPRRCELRVERVRTCSTRVPLACFSGVSPHVQYTCTIGMLQRRDTGMYVRTHTCYVTLSDWKTGQKERMKGNTHLHSCDHPLTTASPYTRTH